MIDEYSEDLVINVESTDFDQRNVELKFSDWFLITDEDNSSIGDVNNKRDSKLCGLICDCESNFPADLLDPDSKKSVVVPDSWLGTDENDSESSISVEWNISIGESDSKLSVGDGVTESEIDNAELSAVDAGVDARVNKCDPSLIVDSKLGASDPDQIDNTEMSDLNLECDIEVGDPSISADVRLCLCVDGGKSDSNLGVKTSAFDTNIGIEVNNFDSNISVDPDFSFCGNVNCPESAVDSSIGNNVTEPEPWIAFEVSDIDSSVDVILVWSDLVIDVDSNDAELRFNAVLSVSGQRTDIEFGETVWIIDFDKKCDLESYIVVEILGVDSKDVESPELRITYDVYNINSIMPIDPYPDWLFWVVKKLLTSNDLIPAAVTALTTWSKQTTIYVLNPKIPTFSALVIKLI